MSSSGVSQEAPASQSVQCYDSHTTTHATGCHCTGLHMAFSHIGAYACVVQGRCTVVGVSAGVD
jgi:hypothetical protein